MPPSPHFFFFNDTATTEIYTLSLHDALPISIAKQLDGYKLIVEKSTVPARTAYWIDTTIRRLAGPERSEEHTSELQSRLHLVCRLLLEKKKKTAQTFKCTKSEPNAITSSQYP